MNNYIDYIMNLELLEYVELGLSALLLLLGYIAVSSKNIVKSVMFLSALSMLTAIAFTFLKALDVAVTEAVIGSGLVTSLFIFTILSMKKGGAKL